MKFNGSQILWTFAKLMSIPLLKRFPIKAHSHMCMVVRVAPPPLPWHMHCRKAALSIRSHAFGKGAGSSWDAACSILEHNAEQSNRSTESTSEQNDTIMIPPNDQREHVGVTQLRGSNPYHWRTASRPSSHARFTQMLQLSVSHAKVKLRVDRSA